MTTLARLIESVCARFEAGDLAYGHGTDNPWDEAVALVLGVTRLGDDAENLGRQIEAADAARIEAIAHERIVTRAPLAHLLGRCRYAGYEFQTSPDVIVPRAPLAFLLGEPIAAELAQPVARILDICCGSGSLGIIAAHAYPQAHVTLIDIEPAAADLARRNLAEHGLAHRADVLCADALSDEIAGAFADAPFDLVLANPPYVNAEDMAALPAEYRAEPRLALAAGDDGLDVMAPLLERLPGWLTSDGLFLGEVGASAPALLQRFRDWPFVAPDDEKMAQIGGEGVFMLRSQDLARRVE